MAKPSHGLPQETAVVLETLQDNLEMVISNIKVREVKKEPGEGFTLQSYFDKLGTTVKALSAESTKFCLAFSEAPIPSTKDCQPLVEGLGKSVLSMVCVYHSLPAGQGLTLRGNIQDCLIAMVTAAKQLLDVIKTYGCHGSRSQLQCAGGVWEKCDAFPHLPKDNKRAVHQVGKGALDLVQDAISELEQAHKEDAESNEEEPDEFDEDEPRWSSVDRQLVAPTLGLLKVAHRTTKKVSDAVLKNGDCSSAATNAELDTLGEQLGRVSPAVDELALTAYPPMDHSALRLQADALCPVLRDLLSAARHTHVTSEDDEKWVTFLGQALDHNITKIHSQAQL